MPRMVVWNEYNLAMENSAYLPLVSGQLSAYAWTHPTIRDAYEVAPFQFRHRPVADILAEYPPTVDVAAFSVSLWNEQLSLSVARAVRLRFPHALIVFGGCQIPFDARAYLAAHPFLDLCARGEGEQTFAAILEARAAGHSYQHIPGLTVRTGDGAVVTPDGTGPKDLDVYPSPYLSNLYRELLETHPELGWQ